MCASAVGGCAFHPSTGPVALYLGFELEARSLPITPVGTNAFKPRNVDSGRPDHWQIPVLMPKRTYSAIGFNCEWFVIE